jgi:hypothetical protein
MKQILNTPATAKAAFLLLFILFSQFVFAQKAKPVAIKEQKKFQLINMIRHLQLTALKKQQYDRHLCLGWARFTIKNTGNFRLSMEH